MDSIDSNEPRLPARLPTARPDFFAPGRPPAEADAPRSNVSLRTALRGVVRYRWLVLVLWMIATPALVAAIYSKVRPSYDAFSLLLVKTAQNNVFGVTMSQDGSSRTYMNTQVTLLKSTNVLRAAIHDDQLANWPIVRDSPDPVQALRDALRVVAEPDSHLIQVSMSSKIRGEAADVINVVVEKYLANNKLFNSATTDDMQKNLQSYRTELVRKLNDEDKKWQALAQKANISPFARPEKVGAEGDTKPVAASKPNSPMELAQEELRQLRNRSIDLEVRLIEASSALAGEKRRFEQMEKQAGASEGTPEGLEAAIDDAIRRDPEVRQVVAEAGKLRDKLGKVSGIARNPHSDASSLELNRRIAGLDADFRRLWSERYPAAREMMLARASGADLGDDPRRALHEAEERVAKLTAAREGVRELIEKSTLMTQKDASDAVQMAIVQETREDLRESIRRISTNLHQIELDNKRGEQVNQQDRAVAGEASGDKRKLYMAAAPMGVLGALLGLVILLEIRAGRVAHPDDLTSRVRAEVFSVPPLPPAPRPSRGLRDLRSREDRVEEFAQRVDHLRVSICGESPDGLGRCVMITSATSGEGKTTLAAQLAMRCANAGSATILIDADLRRATLGRLLDVPGGPGLADVLVGDADAETAQVVIGEAGGFHFLPAGTPGHDPSRVFRGPALGQLLEHLRRTFDVVIVDTPPVLPVPDALTIGRWVDGAVLAVRSDASRFNLVERASRTLASAGIEMLGVVVNGVRGGEGSYRGGHYAGYSSRADEAPSTEVAPT